ncbi:MAG: cupin domain-containing protein [Promethearchaeota archaeon]
MDYRIDFEKIKWNEPATGVRFKSFIFDNTQVRLVEFTDEFVEPDWCTKGHIGYVLEGELEINFDGNIVKYRKDNGLFIPKGAEHKHKAKTITKTVKLILIEEI